MSTDQLAELLNESESADATRAPSADAEVTILPKVQSEVWLDRAEFEDLIRPQAADAQPVSAELSRPVCVDADPEVTIALSIPELPADIALPADVNTASADIRLDTPVGAGGFAGSDVHEPAPANVPDLSTVTTIPLNLPLANIQLRRAGSQRSKRFAAAGVLALAGVAASVLFITSENDPLPPAPATPVAAIPAPAPGSDNTVPGQDSTAPPAALDKPAADLAPSGAAAEPTPKTTRSDRTTSRSKPPAATKSPSPPRTPAIPAEAEAWSRVAEFSGGDHGMPRFGP